jgi:aminodeoxyfutalosine synthase
MSYLGEVSIIEELREYAVARIFLDNFNHIKAYWPMTGKETAQFSLFFGVDDIDGTIHDTTRIYSMSGAKDKNPSLTVTEISSLANQAGLVAVERDSLYNFINTFAL